MTGPEMMLKALVKAFNLEKPVEDAKRQIEDNHVIEKLVSAANEIGPLIEAQKRIEVKLNDLLARFTSGSSATDSERYLRPIGFTETERGDTEPGNVMLASEYINKHRDELA